MRQPINNSMFFRWAFLAALLIAVLAINVSEGNPFKRMTASAAVAPPPVLVTCGMVVTTSIVVGNDLTDCQDDALIVGAHNITIDLNGHTFDGDMFALPPQ